MAEIYHVLHIRHSVTRVYTRVVWQMMTVTDSRTSLMSRLSPISRHTSEFQQFTYSFHCNYDEYSFNDKTSFFLLSACYVRRCINQCYCIRIKKKIDRNCACFWPQIFGGECPPPQNFWTCIIKRTEIHISWQSFTAIGRADKWRKKHLR